VTRKPLVLLLALAIAALALAACGGDDSSSSSSSTSSTTSSEASGGGQTLDIAADPSGQLAFTTGDLDAKAGATTIAFDNESSTPHDVVVEDADGNEVGGTDTVSGGTASADVDLKAGTYTYFCSVDGHRDAGMEGTITVK
jgi:plastocyanin